MLTARYRSTIFALVALIWGTTWVAIKFSLQGFPPFAGAMLRFVVAIIVLLAYVRWKNIPLTLPRTTFRYVLVTSLLLYVLNYGFIYWAEQYLNAGVTAIFFAAVPLVTALASTFAFKSETFCYRRYSGIVIGLVGILIVFFDQLLITAFDGNVIVASVAVLIAAIAAALSVVIVKKHLMTTSAVTLTVHQLLWGTVALGVIAAAKGEFGAIEYSVAAMAALTYLGVAGSALAFVLYYSLLQHTSASTLSTMTYITPLIAVFTGWLLLDESISLRAVLGALTIFIGITVIQFDYLKDWTKNSSLAWRR
jgi:drug/metabolite transporter (DMT)-like permease